MNRRSFLGTIIGALTAPPIPRLTAKASEPDAHWGTLIFNGFELTPKNFKRCKDEMMRHAKESAYVVLPIGASIEWIEPAASEFFRKLRGDE